MGHTSTSASTHVCMQVRNYNVANGITKAVTASLETQDILEAKHRTYRKMLGEVRGLVQLFERELSPSHSSPNELDDAENLKSATTEFVSKNALAAVILADIEISRCILKASLCRHSTSTLVYTALNQHSTHWRCCVYTSKCVYPTAALYPLALLCIHIRKAYPTAPSHLSSHTYAAGMGSIALRRST